jgi:hypothetical protein
MAGTVNMSDIIVGYTEEYQNFKSVRLQGVADHSEHDICAALYGINVATHKSLANFLASDQPTIPILSLQDKFIIKAHDIKAKHVDQERRTITIPLEAFHMKSFIALERPEINHRQYLILFQSHTQEDRVHAITIEKIQRYNPASIHPEQKLVASFPNWVLRERDGWRVKVPQELLTYVQAHEDAVDKKYKTQGGVHKVYNPHIGGGNGWMNITPKITIKRTGKGTKHLY